MKAIAGWIIGVFALGLVVGGVFDGTSAEDKSDASLVANLPAVDCGEGREAVFAPTMIDGATSLAVKCVATEVQLEPAREMERLRYDVATPAPIYVSAPAAAPAPAPTPAPAPVVTAPSRNTAENVEKDDRDWKDSALVIGGAAGAGAGIGALAKGGKGAAVGAAIGGVAGTVYELARKK